MAANVLLYAFLAFLSTQTLSLRTISRPILQHTYKNESMYNRSISDIYFVSFCQNCQIFIKYRLGLISYIRVLGRKRKPLQTVSHLFVLLKQIFHNRLAHTCSLHASCACSHSVHASSFRLHASCFYVLLLLWYENKLPLSRCVY